VAETPAVARQPAWPNDQPGAGVSGEILFLAHRVPYPPNRGDKIRSWHLLREMCKIAPVHVVALCDDPRDLEHLDFLRTVAASVHVEPANPSKLAAMARALMTGQSASVSACYSKALQDHVNTLLATRPIKTIFAFSGQMAQFVPKKTDCRFVMDFVDMDSAKFAEFGGFANGQEAQRLFAHETAVAKRADLSLFVSDAEADLFRRKTGLENIVALENGIDLEAFDPALPRADVPIAAGPLIVFTGQMDYLPNVEAVEDFARNAFPFVLDLVPEAQFAIVGRNPTSDVRQLGERPGITVTGEVVETKDWLAAADVVVAPLLMARGVQNKILEAMAMAKPVVATSAAAEGIDATELRIANVFEDQAADVIELLLDPAAARALGAAARARMMTRYSWESRLAELPSILGFDV
jgi:polysaccharide biosynthesis protein PslH